MSEEQKDSRAQDRLPVEVRAQMLQKETSLYFNLAKFEHAQRIASLFASSTMVPKHFQGNVANCLIALNYADRLQSDPFMVMQNMYVVHGRPGVEAKLVIALINQSGKYAEPLKYRFDGTGDDYGCTAWTKDAKSGELVEGPRVDWKMVKAEGWHTKEGTKWKTIPDVMFRYRAASWFANVHCPELKLGMATVDEINDFVELTETHNGKWVPPAAPQEEEPPPWGDEILSIADNAPRFDDFVRSTLQANRSTEAELRKAANQHPSAFIAAYEMWFRKEETKANEKATPEPTPQSPPAVTQPDEPKAGPAEATPLPAPPEAPKPLNGGTGTNGEPGTTENPFNNRDAYKNFRKGADGLSTFYYRNRKHFPTAKPEAQRDFAAKWKACYPEHAFPGEADLGAPAASDGLSERQPGDDSDDSTFHAERSEREEMVQKIKDAFAPDVISLAKDELGLLTGANQWPPTMSGLNMLFAKCQYLVNAKK